MPFNGSGSYTPPAASFPAVAATLIESAKYNNVVNDIATALTTAITKDGQTTITANLPMAGFRHTGVGNGVARSDYTAMGQAQDGTVNWVVAGGTADALTATYAPTITALVDGQLCFVRAASANATTTPTFSPNGLTAHTITKLGGSAVAVGQWVTDQEVVLRYKLASTRWEIVNPTLTGAQIKPLLSGMAIQTVSVVAGAVATGTTTTPFDDTIPQNTEGDQFMSLAITPTNASSTLEISGIAYVATSAATAQMTLAVFQDTNVNASAAAAAVSTAATGMVALPFRYTQTSGTTSATTFKVRIGANVAGTTTFNGETSTRRFGGTMASNMRIVELLP